MDRRPDIVKQIEAALEHDARVGLHRHPLKIDLGPDGAVILEGELANIAAKKLALEHAAAVAGVSGIIDRLRIAPSRRMADGEIRDHVRDTLLQEAGLAYCAISAAGGGPSESFREAAPRPSCSIEIAVADGVVTLNGQVGSLSHKRLAGVLAWWVPGVRDVINGLEVSPEQQDSDDEIAEAVKLALEKDPLINADRIRVSARNAVVTLAGVAANEAESEMATMDAWFVFGVDGVVSLLAGGG